MPIRSHGFTLIELVIAVAIVGILAAIALPSYLDSIRRGRRVDGQSALLRLQLEEEKWRANNTNYTATLGDLGLTSASSDGFYTIALTAANATGFTATATGSGSQSSDTGCTTLTLVQAGANTTATPTACWRK